MKKKSNHISNESLDKIIECFATIEYDGVWGYDANIGTLEDVREMVRAIIQNDILS